MGFFHQHLLKVFVELELIHTKSESVWSKERSVWLLSSPARSRAVDSSRIILLSIAVKKKVKQLFSLKLWSSMEENFLSLEWPKALNLNKSVVKKVLWSPLWSGGWQQALNGHNGVLVARVWSYLSAQSAFILKVDSFGWICKWGVSS